MSAIELQDTDRRPFFTTNTLAAYLDISPRTVRDMLKRKALPSYKIEGARRIDPADVDKYLRARREER